MVVKVFKIVWAFMSLWNESNETDFFAKDDKKVLFVCELWNHTGMS